MFASKIALALAGSIGVFPSVDWLVHALGYTTTASLNAASMSCTSLNEPPFFATFFFVNASTFGSSSRPLGWASVMSIPKNDAPIIADWGTASGFSTDPE